MDLNVDVLYLFKNNRSTNIVYTNTTKIVQKTIKSIIEEACFLSLSTYEGRISSVKKIYNIKNFTPVYICNQIILQPVCGLREWNQTYINICRIKEILKKDVDSCFVIFDNDLKLQVNLSKVKMNNMVDKCLKIKDDQINKNRRDIIYG